MLNSTKLDNLIEDAVNKKANEISPSKDMFTKISSQINLNEENVSMNFKIKRNIRTIAIACCMLLLISVTAYATVNYFQGGYSNIEFTSDFPNKAQVEKAVNFIPHYVEDFKNGFTFASASIGEAQAIDEKGNIVLSTSTIELLYNKKGIEGEIHVEAQEVVKGIETLADADGESVNISEGIDGVYISYMNKCVPEDYKLTEQDKIDQKNGTYVFSFGEDKFFVKHIQQVAWKQDNIAYHIRSYIDKVTKDEMFKMAAEVINSK